MRRRITDLYFSAYLKCKDYELVDFELIQRGRGAYIFEIEEDEYKKIRIEFFKSDISKIKLIIESLKDLTY